jgi:hypothetical protein
MTNGGGDGKSDTSTRSAKPGTDTAPNWADGDSATGDGRAGPPEETARRKAERELRYLLATHLRDRRRVLAEDGSTPVIGSPPPTYPALAIQRPFAVTVYLAEAEGHRAVQETLDGMLKAFDFDVVASFPALRGSWYRNFIAVSRRTLTSRELGERLRKVERGIELQLVHKQQAEIDSMQGDAVAKLLVALDHTPDALVQIGSVLLVKVDGVPAVRNLTQLELRYLEHNPRLLTSPSTILEALQAVDQPAELVDQDS